VTNEKGKISEADEQARIRDDALDALRDALEWCLTPAEWASVAGILMTMDSGAGGGLDLGDPRQRKALAEATVQLELAGPRRIEEVDRPAELAPPDVRERLNVLIEELSRPGGKEGTPGGKR
jgi:hypothetical protein